MIKLLKQYKFVVLTLLVCLIGATSWLYEQGKHEEILLTKPVEEVQAIASLSIEEEAKEETEVSQKEPQMVPVYVCGEVKKPGVYYMLNTALIEEAIHISGGFTAQANKEYLNLASPIQANGKIIVPKLGEEIDKNMDSYENRESIITQIGSSEVKQSQSESKCININTASLEELMSLPGIGQTKAEAIKTHREEMGGFKSIEELTEVDGIGDKTFEKIKQLITIQ